MEDFLLLDELFTPDEILIRDNVRRFVDAEVRPQMTEAFEQGFFPESLIPKMAELGLFGMTLPSEWGGANTSYMAYGLACQELERGDSAVRSFASVQSSLCMYPIYRYGTEEQKQRFLKKMAAGEYIGCFGLTEAEAGSDPASMKTTAQRVAEGWLLNGSKMWITNGSLAHLAVVFAQTSAGIRGFIVEKGTPGFSTQLIKHKLSLRVSVSSELIFENCVIPDANYLPGSEKGLSVPLSCLTQARYGIAWGAMGAAMACYDIAVQYLKERQQFNKPLASFQLIQRDLAQIFVEIQKGILLNWRIGKLKDQGQDQFIHTSLIKLNACREALKITRMVRNLLGANGISLEYEVIRHMANLESIFTYEGTDNIHTLILGKHITGIDAIAR